MEKTINNDEFHGICRSAFHDYYLTVYTNEAEELLWRRVLKFTNNFFDRETINEKNLEPSKHTWMIYLDEVVSNRKNEDFDHMAIAETYVKRMMSGETL